MPAATLHDGSEAEITVQGDGPAILLPVSVAPVTGEAAEQLRQWGADPALGATLAARLAQFCTVVACDYESALARVPKPGSLTAAAVAADLLSIADAAGCDRFAYYGYSWLALAGLQLAIRTDRLTALAMGGFPPLGAPYPAMLTVTEATARMAAEAAARPGGAPDPGQGGGTAGDWDSVDIALTEAQAGQYVTLYQSLRGFDERAALARVTCPRVAFAGDADDISYGPRWGGARVEIGSALRRHQQDLRDAGWTVTLLPGHDHLQAMQAGAVLDVLVPWLRAALAIPAGLGSAGPDDVTDAVGAGPLPPDDDQASSPAE
jgi:pimeloyl-ACP methyl ester carboxylesterase